MGIFLCENGEIPMGKYLNGGLQWFSTLYPPILVACEFL